MKIRATDRSSEGAFDSEVASDVAPLYSAAQVRELDRRAIREIPIEGYTLMCRAAEAAWGELLRRCPRLGRIDVVCGAGNNGGDGYVIARLAKAFGHRVQVWSIGQPRPGTEAEQAWRDWHALGESRPFEKGCLQDADVIVDALLGTGLSREVGGAEAEAIAAMAEQTAAWILAVDIPSGLSADTGQPLPIAVPADLTVTFIGRKLGLHTGAAADYTGDIVFCDLGVPTATAVEPLGWLLDRGLVSRHLKPRARSAHKGRSGLVLLVGGDRGYTGAILLASRAALRTGAGLVAVATRGEHAAMLAAALPEAMFKGTDQGDDLLDRADKAKVIAIGPGLGRSEWAARLWKAALATPLPLVVDADALNLLAAEPLRRGNWVLTPHPGEAARLLGCGIADIERDRVAAVRALVQRYGGSVVLKGAGSLIGGERLAVCPFGNPGMAVGGMGDALTGVIAALIAQGLGLQAAAEVGVAVHALAGDLAARDGERGLLPSDLIECLRGVVNS
jgi:NAD(P)H-hydrate epimerase